MAQPTRFTISTDFSEDEADGVAGRSTVLTAQLDGLFSSLKTTLDQICDNLAILQRDDTALADRIVSLASLSSGVRSLIATAGTTPRGDWVTATAYAVKDVVTNSTGTYLCAVAHTSGTFATDLAADKWIVLFDTASYIASGIAFTPTGNIAATNVQNALAELDTEKLSATMATDRLLGRESSGSGAVEEISLGAGLTMDSTTLLLGSLPVSGRLTLTSGTPVTASEVSGAATVYFTPFKGDKIPLYDGTRWKWHTFTELSQATTDSTKSPAAVANNSNYDKFVWNDSGTLRCTRGPAWSSDTARGTGAATTEIELFEGRYVNKYAITNGPAARCGLYVGTIRSDGSAQINDTLTKRCVWNLESRATRPMRKVISTDTYNYTTATIRQADGDTANKLEFVRGLDEDSVSASCVHTAKNSTASIPAVVGIGLDSTSTFSGERGVGTGAANAEFTIVGQYRGLPGLGYHYLSFNEYSQATGTATWVGDNGSTITQAGISAEVRA